MKLPEKNRIIFTFTNSFTKKMICAVEMKYDPYKSLNGYYSTLYKKYKKSIAFGYENSLVVGKISFGQISTDRTIINLGKMALDIPSTINKNDIEIIKHYMEALRLSIK